MQFDSGWVFCALATISAVYWNHWFMSKIFVSMWIVKERKGRERSALAPTHYQRLIPVFMESHLSSAQLHRHKCKKWSKYEDQVHAIILIYMNRAGSRIVFNNNSPTCNAFRMTESTMFVAIWLAFSLMLVWRDTVRCCWLFKNGDTSAPSHIRCVFVCVYTYADMNLIRVPRTWMNEHRIIIKMRNVFDSAATITAAAAAVA